MVLVEMHRPTNAVSTTYILIILFVIATMCTVSAACLRPASFRRTVCTSQTRTMPADPGSLNRC